MRLVKPDGSFGLNTKKRQLDNASTTMLTKVREKYLADIGLDLDSKRVLIVGSDQLVRFFVDRRCEVTYLPSPSARTKGRQEPLLQPGAGTSIWDQEGGAETDVPKSSEETAEVEPELALGAEESDSHLEHQVDGRDAQWMRPEDEDADSEAELAGSSEGTAETQLDTFPPRETDSHTGQASDLDIEEDDLTLLGAFDIVACFDLFESISRPDRVLLNLIAVSRNLLLIEASMFDDRAPSVLILPDQDQSNEDKPSMAGCRPSPAYVIDKLLQNGMPYLYVPTGRPFHDDFRFKYEGKRACEHGKHHLRQFFVASRMKLDNPGLAETRNGSDIDTPDPLDKLPTALLKVLAQRRYRPEPLAPCSSWYVDSGETAGEQRRLMERLWRVLRRKSRNSVQVDIRWYGGIKLRLPLNDEIARCIFVQGVFEPNQFYFLEKYLEPGMVLADVGANNGLYSLFAASKVEQAGQVLAIEPSAREFAKLAANISANRYKNIASMQVALGADKALCKLQVAKLPYSGHNTLGTFGYEATGVDHEEPLVVTTLDEVAATQQLDRLDVIKIDVEGAELAVLQGGMQTLRRFRPLVLIELSDRTLSRQGASSLGVVEQLRSLGYTLLAFGPEGSLERLGEQEYYDGANVIAVPDEKLSTVLA